MARQSVPAALAALVVLSSPLHAQASLTGRWQGETNNGAQIVLDLTVKGAALSGTFTRGGETTTITDGKVSGSTFTFNVKRADQTEGLTGELAGDHVSLWLDRQGRSNALTLKRVKN